MGALPTNACYNGLTSLTRFETPTIRKKDLDPEPGCQHCKGEFFVAMTIHLYLSLIPEALIASMLPPEEFGLYYAVGAHRKLHGQAMFIELDPDFRHDFFRIEEGYSRCVPHENGAPKRSVYISAYRVLEHVPLDAYRKLYLVTGYGEVLGLEQSQELPEKKKNRGYMYQEIAPVRPLIVSTQDPVAFNGFLTEDPDSMIHLPAICFVDLKLGKLAKDPEHGAVRDLPYAFMHHLRECLVELRDKTIRHKMVNRVQPIEFPYRMIRSGVYIGKSEEGLAYFPMPSVEELRRTHYRWWRSANV